MNPFQKSFYHSDRPQATAEPNPISQPRASEASGSRFTSCAAYRFVSPGRRISPRPVAETVGLKIGIVSDIHCNAAGLKIALDRMGQVDELLCLGDAIFEYQFSNEVVALLRDRGAHIIQGNHEEVFLSPAGSRARERPGLDPELVRFLAAQPLRKELQVGGKKLLMVHSTPWEPRGEYVHPHSSKLARFAEADADYVLYGHTHVQVVRRIGRVLVINPGSVGDGRDSNNGRQLSYGILDTATDRVDVLNFPDPRFMPKP